MPKVMEKKTGEKYASKAKQKKEYGKVKRK